MPGKILARPGSLLLERLLHQNHEAVFPRGSGAGPVHLRAATSSFGISTRAATRTAATCRGLVTAIELVREMNARLGKRVSKEIWPGPNIRTRDEIAISSAMRMAAWTADFGCAARNACGSSMRRYSEDSRVFHRLGGLHDLGEGRGNDIAKTPHKTRLFATGPRPTYVNYIRRHAP
jgi:hypothetical protein